jgi:AraC-like DNA-binding protein
VTEPIYREYEPRGSLADFVQCLWTFSAPADEAPQRIAPDGRCELIVHLRAPYEELREGRAVVQPPVLFAGQITRPLTLVARSDVLVFGVRFRPDGARAFLGVDLDLATDQRVGLLADHGDAVVVLRNALASESRLEARLGAIQDYVEARIAASARVPAIDPVVRAAVTRVLAGEDIEAPRDLSERQWQRRFKAEIGVSPRMLQTVLRFRRVFDAIEHPETSGWIEAALAAGYFDQPQMARDFRRFLGCTARAWAAQRAGLAKALTAPETYKTT